MSALASFFGGASATSNYRDLQRARTLQEKQIMLAEEQAQAGRNLDSFHAAMGAARRLGVLGTDGQLDEVKLQDLLQKGRDTNNFSNDLHILATAIGNSDLTVQRNPGFSFKQLTVGPEDTLTMVGNYDGQDQQKVMTMGAGSGPEEEATFATTDSVARLLGNQWNTLSSRPGVAPLWNELQAKLGLVDASGRAAEENRDIEVRKRVAQSVDTIDAFLLENGRPDLSRRLKGALSQAENWEQQLEILDHYAKEAGIPLPEPVTTPTEPTAPALSQVDATQRQGGTQPSDIAGLEPIDETPRDPSMYRSDGSKKSARGYLGPVKNNVEGGTMTEVSIGVEINGEEIEVPAMVPTLTQAEVDTLANMRLEGNAKNIPESIKQKAVAHAKQRLKEGKSVFYVDGEESQPSQVAPEAAQKAEEIATKAQAAGDNPRQRTALQAQAKALGASDDAKEFADSQDGSEQPQEVPEQDQNQLIQWVQENPVDAAMLAASGVLLFAGPVGWAVRGGLTALRATPQAARWIASRSAQGVKGAVSKPKYPGPPRNNKGQLTKSGQEARTLSATRLGATGAVITGTSIAVQEMLEQADAEEIPEPVKELAAETAEATEEDIVQGRITVTPEQITALRKSLDLKGIRSLAEMDRATLAEQQALRAALSVFAQDAQQRTDYNNALMNVMETGSASYNQKDLDTARSTQFSNETARINAETSRINAETSRNNSRRQYSELMDKLGEDTNDQVRAAVDTVREVLFDDDGTPLDIDMAKVDGAFSGSIADIWRQYNTQEKNLKRNRNNRVAALRSAQFERALDAQLSAYMQIFNRSDEPEISFLATDSGAPVSLSDNQMSRIKIAETDAGGNPTVFHVLKDDSKTQDGDAITAAQFKSKLGNEKLYEYFIEKLKTYQAARQ